MTVIGAKNGTVLIAPVFSVLVSASSVVDVDSILISSFSAIDYLMSFSNSTNLRINRMMIRNNGLSLSDQIFARSGYNFAIAVQSIVSGSDFKLRVTNSESFSVLVKFSKSVI